MKASKTLALGVLLLGVVGVAASISYAITFHTVKNTAQLDLPRLTVYVGSRSLDVQVASTQTQQALGLMHRTSLPENEGMLFVFPKNFQPCLWMENTHVPLTAAFIADDGTIVNLADMAPLSPLMHCAVRPIRYVLEMNQNLDKYGIIVGAKVGKLPLAGPAIL